MDGDYFTIGKKLIETRHLDAHSGAEIVVRMNVMGQDAAIEGLQQTGKILADIAEPDDADRAAGQLPARDLPPFAARNKGKRCRHSTDQRQGETKRQFGDGGSSTSRSPSAASAAATELSPAA